MSGMYDVTNLCGNTRRMGDNLEGRGAEVMIILKLILNKQYWGA